MQKEKDQLKAQVAALQKEITQHLTGPLPSSFCRLCCLALAAPHICSIHALCCAEATAKMTEHQTGDDSSESAASAGVEPLPSAKSGGKSGALTLAVQPSPALSLPAAPYTTTSADRELRRLREEAGRLAREREEWAAERNELNAQSALLQKQIATYREAERVRMAERKAGRARSASAAAEISHSDVPEIAPKEYVCLCCTVLLLLPCA